MRKVYFDSAATTQVRKEVIEKMTQVMSECYGNPSSTHAFGRAAKTLIEQARKDVAKHLNVSAGEIIFTSGGTEADNLAICSSVKDLGVTRIITSRIEHHAVLHTVQEMQDKHNVTVDYVNLKDCGSIDSSHLEELLGNSTEKTLVSLMHINNEVGNMLDIKAVAKLCKSHNALFHCDTVQSVGHFKLDFSEIPVDFTAVSAHKFHGPKGVGFAFIRKNSGLKPMIVGGSQERGIRAGTELLVYLKH
jgi:cysteine desulfurase